MAEPTIQDAIEQNALGPSEVSTSAGRVKQHSLQEQIEADRYLRDQTAAGRNHRGLSFVKLIRPGAS